MSGEDPTAQALAQLGRLEARIMREVWSGRLPDPFVVRDISGMLDELAYTTVMTTVNRLADKGLLQAFPASKGRATSFRTAGDPETYLAKVSRRQVDRLVNDFGDAALAAFAAQLDTLTPERRRRLRDLATE
ncbi:MAG: BlaI/MecI/CopY family transcriptional regulator [Candidatus Dormibacteria bacterium]